MDGKCREYTYLFCIIKKWVCFYSQFCSKASCIKKIVKVCMEKFCWISVSISICFFYVIKIVNWYTKPHFQLFIQIHYSKSISICKEHQKLGNICFAQTLKMVRMFRFARSNVRIRSIDSRNPFFPIC